MDDDNQTGMGVAGHADTPEPVSTRSGTPLVDVLGRHAAELEFSQLSDLAVISAKTRILDVIGCALAAATTDTARVLMNYCTSLDLRGSVPLWGPRSTADPLEAAFINATLSHALLRDDTDLEAGHVACQIVPAALSALCHRLAHPTGEDSDNYGSELLAAIVVGYDVMWRASVDGKVTAGANSRGFRGYILNGAIGAAAAAGRGLGLTAEQCAHAISCAANTVSGLLEPVGTASLERPMMAGTNARTGVQAALLAASGLTGTPTALEGDRGYFNAVASIKVDPEQVAKPFTVERILSSDPKLYPSAGANQSAIHAAATVHERHPIDLSQVRRVHVEQYPLFGEGVPTDTGEPAYPSIASTGPYASIEEVLPNKPFGVAVMLAYGRLTAETIRAGLEDPVVSALATKVSSSGAPQLGPWQATIRVELTNRTYITESIDCSHDLELTEDNIRTRMADLCGRYCSEAQLDELVDDVFAIAQSRGARRLVSTLQCLQSVTP